MTRNLILAPPPKEYNSYDEAIRNREIEASIKALIQKVNELESRIKAGGL